MPSCLPDGYTRPSVSSTYNPVTGEVKTGGLEVQGRWLLKEFEAA